MCQPKEDRSFSCWKVVKLDIKHHKCTDLHSHYTELAVPSLHRLLARQYASIETVNFLLQGRHKTEKPLAASNYFYQKINIQCAEEFQYIQNLQKHVIIYTV